MPVLYIVATPIGNLEDITLRALRVLREVKLIAAEDTRSARRLLAAHQIKTPVTSYYEHNKDSKLPYLIDQLREYDVALISDAGMPAISDPGYELVKGAIAQDIPVVPIPGPSAITTALAASGLPAAEFIYIGFLPRRAGQRRRLLDSLSSQSRTMVAFEAPHRVAESLQDILNAMGDRRITVARELTKIHEEVFRGTVSQALERFVTPRGEFTIVISGATAKPPETPEADVEAELRRLKKSGRHAREAVAELATRTGQPRKRLYAAWLSASGKL